jgi:hypothetical protein
MSSLFGCSPVDTDGSLVLDLDPRISCSNPLYVTAEYVARIAIAGLALLPPLAIGSVLMGVAERFETYSSHTMDIYGPLCENYTPSALPYFGALKVFRRGVTAVALSNIQSILPFFESIENRSLVVLVVNGSYAVALVLLRPYSRKVRASEAKRARARSARGERAWGRSEHMVWRAGGRSERKRC